MGISGSDRQKLIEAALEAREKSYSPYSKFRVGAALMCSDGRIFCGTNIENASYSLTVCAERSAYFAAVSAGAREFTAIALSGGSGDVLDDYCTPCGACRQVMSEFSPSGELTVISAKSASDYKSFTLSQLLPATFTL